MLDDTPWFRRWLGFSFVPIRWKGWAATAAFAFVEVVVGMLSLQIEPVSLAWWLLAAVGVAIFLAFYAFVISRSGGL